MAATSDGNVQNPRESHLNLDSKMTPADLPEIELHVLNKDGPCPTTGPSDVTTIVDIANKVPEQNQDGDCCDEKAPAFDLMTSSSSEDEADSLGSESSADECDDVMDRKLRLRRQSGSESEDSGDEEDGEGLREPGGSSTRKNNGDTTGAADEEEELLFEGYVPVAFRCLKQTSTPRRQCLRLLTWPYPF